MSPPALPPLHILHVEDSIADAEIIGNLLQEEWPGSTIQRVASEPEMSAALGANKWDVVLSDFSMPGFNGLTALELVRARTEAVPFIFLSGTIGEENAVEALKRGATDYVIKDRMTRLVPAIHRALEDVRKEAERRSLETQLRRTQRLESIGLLAGGIAHDLNNMLAPIVMGTELMRQTVTDPRMQRMLDIMSRSAEHGAELVKQVLAFTKGTEGERQVLQVEPLIRDMSVLLRETLSRSIDIKVDVPADLWSVTSDATQLNQVLMNLCVNARDAMPHGGVLKISATNRHLGEANVKNYPGVQPGPFVAITVEDTGTGIPPELIERIFEPFFTTKEQKGTGLGLSTVIGIVKAHSGFLAVESVPGKGTAFRLFFPAVAAKQVVAETKTPFAPQSGDGQVILVVDDEVSLRELIRSLLEAYGYRVLLAVDGANAIEMGRKHVRDIGLILSDINMPGLHRDEMIAALRAVNPEVKIILMSGGDEGLGLTQELKCQGFLAKPMSAETLVTTISRVLEQEKPSLRI